MYFLRYIQHVFLCKTCFYNKAIVYTCMTLIHLSSYLLKVNFITNATDRTYFEILNILESEKDSITKANKSSVTEISRLEFRKYH